jgi:hypothetical protein
LLTKSGTLLGSPLHTLLTQRDSIVVASLDPRSIPHEMSVADARES